MHQHNTTHVGLLPVLAALIGNSVICVLKFIGFFVSGSSALFSEAVHSFADTSNQALLLIGIKRSAKKADANFAYGYGQERFIWALISALGIFFIGAGVTVYHGFSALARGEVVVHSSFVYVVLITALVVESITLLFAIKDILRTNPDSTLYEIMEDGDPITLAVIYEDSVAVLGVIIALISIILTNATGEMFWDALGSILIGVMLGCVAVILVNKNRQYLIRKSIPDEIQDEILELLNKEPAIEKVIDFKSSVINIGEYQIKCEVEFNGSVLIRELFKNTTIREEYDEIKDDYEEFLRFCSDFADRVPRLVGKMTDDIEKRLEKKFPYVKHIDIEIN